MEPQALRDWELAGRGYAMMLLLVMVLKLWLLRLRQPLVAMRKATSDVTAR